MQASFAVIRVDEHFRFCITPSRPDASPGALLSLFWRVGGRHSRLDRIEQRFHA